MSLLHHIYALFIIILLFVCLHRPSERTDEDIQLIYDELLHVKAFSHLSNAVSNTHTHNIHAYKETLSLPLQSACKITKSV